MSSQTVTLLIDAGLFGLATALICLAFGLAGFAVWQVYKAIWSDKAKRNRAFQRRLAINKAHNRRLLGLTR